MRVGQVGDRVRPIGDGGGDRERPLTCKHQRQAVTVDPNAGDDQNGNHDANLPRQWMAWARRLMHTTAPNVPRDVRPDRTPVPISCGAVSLPSCK